jgi:hypothetical protein
LRQCHKGNRQGQAHIVSTASRLRTWFSIDPQPASISPTINISIVFICAFPVDCGQIILSGNPKTMYSAILRKTTPYIILPLPCGEQKRHNPME